ncbi:hypothetical protein AMECASPLE_039613 [Ameca splendens]|uniref:Secreted protein n=1 Tax=Ameca splendens TaxID=208324 RepID=A0ABV0ZH98_9TELE
MRSRRFHIHQEMQQFRMILVLVVFRFIRDRVAGAADSAETPRRPSPQTPPPAPPGGAQGVPRPVERHGAFSVSWAVPWNTSRGRRPGGIQYRCPSHLNWLLLMWRSSGSTPSPSWMAELLTLSLRECPATLRRKLISAACIRDLVLSVMTQSSWP